MPLWATTTITSHNIPNIIFPLIYLPLDSEKDSPWWLLRLWIFGLLFCLWYLFKCSFPRIAFFRLFPCIVLFSLCFLCVGLFLSSCYFLHNLNHILKKKTKKKNLCPYIEIVIQFNSPIEGIREYHKIRRFEFHLSSNSLRIKVIYNYL
jgi:hypothetical protein